MPPALPARRLPRARVSLIGAVALCVGALAGCAALPDALSAAGARLPGQSPPSAPAAVTPGALSAREDTAVARRSWSPSPVTDPAPAPAAPAAPAATPAPVTSPAAPVKAAKPAPAKPSSAAPVAPAPPAPPAAPPSGMNAYASRLLALTNQARANAGLPALAQAGCAQSVASNWSWTMSQEQRLYHQPLGNVSGACSGSRSVGENIARGNVSADRIFEGWMSSPGHRDNILRPGFTQVAIASVQDSRGVWWSTQDFVQR